MFQEIAPHVYHNEMRFDAPQPDDFTVCIQPGGVSANLDADKLLLPHVSDFSDASFRYLFRIDEKRYYLLLEGKLQSGEWGVVPHAQIRSRLADETMFAVAVAQSLHRWYAANRFCGKCAQQMEPSKTERALVCPSCGNTVYPKICPAVIVAVTDGDRIVLTRYKNRPFKKYALIAGFSEIGETVEQTVHREVLEETGLRVKNLRFYKSQPWVFTDTLLMGFYCELEGSDVITPQEDELAEAKWVSRSEIPNDFSPISLTGEMITQFQNGKY